MRLRQLELLLDIVETHSITVTAERFYMTQQTVSNNIKQLEEEVGAVLLKRNPHGVALTVQGKTMAEFAARVLKDYDKTRTIMGVHEEVPETLMIHLGTASLLNSIVLPNVLNMVDSGQCNFNINVQEESPEHLLRKLIDKEFDVGFLTFNTESLNALERLHGTDALNFHVLMEDQLVACVNVQSDYAAQEHVSAFQMASYRKAICGIYPIQEYEKDALAHTVICSNDVMLHRKLLLKKDFFVLMPQLVYNYFFKGKKFMALPLELPKPVTESHCMIYRKEMAEPLSEFIKIVEECIRQV